MDRDRVKPATSTRSFGGLPRFCTASHQNKGEDSLTMPSLRSKAYHPEEIGSNIIKLVTRTRVKYPFKVVQEIVTPSIEQSINSLKVRNKDCH